MSFQNAKQLSSLQSVIFLLPDNMQMKLCTITIMMRNTN